ncbi:MAG: hypothetical protein QW165_04795 [Candidatus Woesearchaeota archaeon]
MAELTDSAKLVAYGFVKKGVDKSKIALKGRTIEIKGKTGKERYTSICEEFKKLTADEQKEFNEVLRMKIANHEWVEVARDQMVMTSYPKSISRYYMGIETPHQSVEAYYYWCMNFLGDIGFPVIHKITDVFTAAEHSSFYGAAGQRLGLAQDKVSQYLATIGKMVKDLFQLVRELRWIDERLEIYRAAFAHDKEGKPLKNKKPEKGAEQALKGMWVDLVDGVVGGQRTGSNLFVMAQQLQFTALPDLFFSITPPDVDKVNETVENEAASFNEPLRNLLKRKLAQYLAWKKSTYEEMQSRRRFTIDYLRQHYEVIRMYMQWVKPYIKHIERLSGEQDLLNNPRLIAAFESSLVEIEVLGIHRPEGSKQSYACILMTFEYHTKPQMQYPGDSGYHRGPIHVGSTRITWRSYAWTEQQVEEYLEMRRIQDFELLSSVDKSLKSAMDVLGNDMFNYLKEAEQMHKEKKPEEPEKRQPINILEPFTAVGKGVKEAFGGLVPDLKAFTFGGKKEKPKEEPNETMARKLCWVHYNIFKKAHGLLAW